MKQLSSKVAYYESIEVEIDQKILEVIPIGFKNAITARETEIRINRKYPDSVVPSAVAIGLRISKRLSDYIRVIHSTPKYYYKLNNLYPLQ